MLEYIAEYIATVVSVWTVVMVIGYIERKYKEKKGKTYIVVKRKSY